MNRKTTNPEEDDDMLPEYDFRGQKATRGKHAKTMQEGYTITIHQEDGTTIVQNFTLQENTVVLDPDVRAHYPDSKSVNTALRELIKLTPAKNRQVGEKKAKYHK